VKPKRRILVVDDEPGFAGSLKKLLDAEGYTTAIALRGDHGLSAARREKYDIVITDLNMPGLSGLELIDRLHAVKPRLPIILMTARGTTDSAIEATRLGASEYLLKPFATTDLLALVARLAQCNGSAPVLLDLGSNGSAAAAMVGRSPAMQSLFKDIGRAAKGAMTVLIRGETGSGKELVVRAIHRHSSRAAEPFIAINCAAIPEGLLESELFGHERGAFTTALTQRIGRFEQARGGTLFLDEIGDLSPGTQVKLLRVLQERTLERVGGNKEIRVKARVMAATHRNLEAAITHEHFRQDLFYRLNPVTVWAPALREHLEDIPDLVRHCLVHYSADVGVVTPSIQLDAVDYLRQQPWLGNVRELQNVVQQALLLANNEPIALAHVQAALACARRPQGISGQTIASYLADVLAKAQQEKIKSARDLVTEDLERELFTLAFHLAAGNQAQAARWLGVTRKTLRVKLVHLGLLAAALGPAMQAAKES
jgi:DNA-binding NtrC family response regulator